MCLHGWLFGAWIQYNNGVWKNMLPGNKGSIQAWLDNEIGNKTYSIAGKMSRKVDTCTTQIHTHTIPNLTWVGICAFGGPIQLIFLDWSEMKKWPISCIWYSSVRFMQSTHIVVGFVVGCDLISWLNGIEQLRKRGLLRLRFLSQIEKDSH